MSLMHSQIVLISDCILEVQFNATMSLQYHINSVFVGITNLHS